MNNTILIVDDELINLAILRDLFKDRYEVRTCRSGEEALEAVMLLPRPDIILLDIIMPGIDGYTTLARIHENPETSDIPVIFITGLDRYIDEDKGFKLGAVDYITKPFRPSIVYARVNSHLELKQARDRLKDQNEWLEVEIELRMREIQFIQDASLYALSQLVETRDDSTGNHIERTCRYLEVLARRLREDNKYVEELGEKAIAVMVKAAPLHDIGKIGIRDSILLKPGRLTPEEFEIIKGHCIIGAQAMRSAINKALSAVKDENIEKVSPEALMFLEQAEIIAKYHHEKWDGSGYPCGLKGLEIPLPARLMALADVFDALTTARPYKNAWSMEETAEYIIGLRGIQFDPEIVDAFVKEIDTLSDILKSLTEE